MRWRHVSTPSHLRQLKLIMPLSPAPVRQPRTRSRGRMPGGARTCCRKHTPRFAAHGKHTRSSPAISQAPVAKGHAGGRRRTYVAVGVSSSAAAGSLGVRVGGVGRVRVIERRVAVAGGVVDWLHALVVRAGAAVGDVCVAAGVSYTSRSSSSCENPPSSERRRPRRSRGRDCTPMLGIGPPHELSSRSQGSGWGMGMTGSSVSLDSP